MESHSDGETWGLAVSGDHIVTSGDDNKIKTWNSFSLLTHFYSQGRFIQSSVLIIRFRGNDQDFARDGEYRRAKFNKKTGKVEIETEKREKPDSVTNHYLYVN